MSSLRRRLHVLFLWILTVRISITLFKTATLSSKFGNSSILFSNQTVILFVWWIIFKRFGEVRCFMSSFVQTLPTSSEGRTALKTMEAEITEFLGTDSQVGLFNNHSMTTTTIVYWHFRNERQHEDFEKSSTQVTKIVGSVVSGS